jgi:hypothetical protein
MRLSRSSGSRGRTVERKSRPWHSPYSSDRGCGQSDTFQRIRSSASCRRAESLWRFKPPATFSNSAFHHVKWRVPPGQKREQQREDRGRIRGLPRTPGPRVPRSRFAGYRLPRPDFDCELLPADTPLRGGIPDECAQRQPGCERSARVVAISPRPGMQRLIIPWEYRHLRAFGITRIAGGSVAAAARVVCLSYGVYGWAAFFLVIAALNLAGGCWYIAIARSPSARA